MRIFIIGWRNISVLIVIVSVRVRVVDCDAIKLEARSLKARMAHLLSSPKTRTSSILELEFELETRTDLPPACLRSWIRLTLITMPGRIDFVGDIVAEYNCADNANKPLVN